MATAVEHALLTTDDLLALPDDGVERWLIDGELREKTMTVRNRFHSRVTARVTAFLDRWNDVQTQFRGEVVNGEAGFRLSRNPDTTVGVDVAYVSGDVLATSNDTTLFEGAPVLAVEVLSPSDVQQDIHEKLQKYLDAGTKQVWIIDPAYLTVTVYEAGKEPVLYNREHEVPGDPYLPGFRLAVSQLLTTSK